VPSTPAPVAVSASSIAEVEEEEDLEALLAVAHKAMHSAAIAMNAAPLTGGEDQQDKPSLIQQIEDTM
jgi:hypothetical protein